MFCQNDMFLGEHAKTSVHSSWLNGQLGTRQGELWQMVCNVGCEEHLARCRAEGRWVTQLRLPAQPATTWKNYSRLELPMLKALFGADSGSGEIVSIFFARNFKNQQNPCEFAACHSNISIAWGPVSSRCADCPSRFEVLTSQRLLGSLILLCS